MYDEYVTLVQQEILSFKNLIHVTEPNQGYGLEERSSIIRDTFLYFLKGNISEKQYNKLYLEWKTVLNQVYTNKNLCIC